MLDVKSKLMRALGWVIMNSILVVCVYFGAYQDYGWAANVVYFIVILDFISNLLVAVNPKATNKMKMMGRSVPKQIAYIYDVGIIIALAGVGWWWMAGLFTVSVSTQVNIFDMDLKDEEVKHE